MSKGVAIGVPIALILLIMIIVAIVVSILYLRHRHQQEERDEVFSIRQELADNPCRDAAISEQYVRDELSLITTMIHRASHNAKYRTKVCTLYKGPNFNKGWNNPIIIGEIIHRALAYDASIRGLMKAHEQYVGPIDKETKHCAIAANPFLDPFVKYPHKMTMKSLNSIIEELKRRDKLILSGKIKGSNNIAHFLASAVPSGVYASMELTDEAREQATDSSRAQEILMTRRLLSSDEASQYVENTFFSMLIHYAPDGKERTRDLETFTENKPYLKLPDADNSKKEQEEIENIFHNLLTDGQREYIKDSFLADCSSACDIAEKFHLKIDTPHMLDQGLLLRSKTQDMVTNFHTLNQQLDCGLPIYKQLTTDHIQPKSKLEQTIEYFNKESSEKHTLNLFPKLEEMFSFPSDYTESPSVKTVIKLYNNYLIPCMRYASCAPNKEKAKEYFKEAFAATLLFTDLNNMTKKLFLKEIDPFVPSEHQEQVLLLRHLNVDNVLQDFIAAYKPAPAPKKTSPTPQVLQDIMKNAKIQAKAKADAHHASTERAVIYTQTLVETCKDALKRLVPPVTIIIDYDILLCNTWPYNRLDKEKHYLWQNMDLFEALQENPYLPNSMYKKGDKPHFWKIFIESYISPSLCSKQECLSSQIDYCVDKSLSLSAVDVLKRTLEHMHNFLQECESNIKQSNKEKSTVTKEATLTATHYPKIHMIQFISSINIQDKVRDISNHKFKESMLYLSGSDNCEKVCEYINLSIKDEVLQLDKAWQWSHLVEYTINKTSVKWDENTENIPNFNPHIPIKEGALNITGRTRESDENALLKLSQIYEQITLQDIDNLDIVLKRHIKEISQNSTRDASIVLLENIDLDHIKAHVAEKLIKTHSVHITEEQYTKLSAMVLSTCQNDYHRLLKSGALLQTICAPHHSDNYPKYCNNTCLMSLLTAYDSESYCKQPVKENSLSPHQQNMLLLSIFTTMDNAYHVSKSGEKSLLSKDDLYMKWYNSKERRLLSLSPEWPQGIDIDQNRLYTLYLSNTPQEIIDASVKKERKYFEEKLKKFRHPAVICKKSFTFSPATRFFSVINTSVAMSLCNLESYASIDKVDTGMPAFFVTKSGEDVSPLLTAAILQHLNTNSPLNDNPHYYTDKHTTQSLSQRLKNMHYNTNKCFFDSSQSKFIPSEQEFTSILANIDLETSQQRFLSYIDDLLPAPSFVTDYNTTLVTHANKVLNSNCTYVDAALILNSLNIWSQNQKYYYNLNHKNANPNDIEPCPFLCNRQGAPFSGKIACVICSLLQKSSFEDYFALNAINRSLSHLSIQELENYLKKSVSSSAIDSVCFINPISGKPDPTEQEIRYAIQSIDLSASINALTDYILSKSTTKGTSEILIASKRFVNVEYLNKAEEDVKNFVKILQTTTPKPNNEHAFTGALCRWGEWMNHTVVRAQESKKLLYTNSLSGVIRSSFLRRCKFLLTKDGIPLPPLEACVIIKALSDMIISGNSEGKSLREMLNNIHYTELLCYHDKEGQLIPSKEKFDTALQSIDVSKSISTFIDIFNEVQTKPSNALPNGNNTSDLLSDPKKPPVSLRKQSKDGNNTVPPKPKRSNDGNNTSSTLPPKIKPRSRNSNTIQDNNTQPPKPLPRKNTSIKEDDIHDADLLSPKKEESIDPAVNTTEPSLEKTNTDDPLHSNEDSVHSSLSSDTPNNNINTNNENKDKDLPTIEQSIQKHNAPVKGGDN